MPYRSVAQQRYMHAAHPELAREWDKETKAAPGGFKALPKKVKKKTHKKRADLAEYVPENWEQLAAPMLAGAGVGGVYGAIQAPGKSRLRGALIGSLGGAGAGAGLTAANQFLSSPHAAHLENTGVQAGIVLGGAGIGMGGGLSLGRRLARAAMLGDEKDKYHNDLEEIDPVRRGHKMLPEALSEYVKRGSVAAVARAADAICKSAAVPGVKLKYQVPWTVTVQGGKSRISGNPKPQAVSPTAEIAKPLVAALDKEAAARILAQLLS